MPKISIKNIKQYFAIFCLLLNTYTNGFSQTNAISAVLLKIQQAYKEANVLTINYTTEMFKNYKTNIVFEKNEGSFCRQDNIYYSKFGIMESVTGKYTLLKIDNEDQKIVISEKPQNYSFIDQFSFTTLMKVFNNQNEIKLSDKYSKIIFQTPKKSGFEYEKIEITYDVETYFLHKIVMYYASEIDLNGDRKTLVKPRVEFNFIDHLKIIPSQNKLLISNYISTKAVKGNYLAGINYKKYRVIDLRFKEKGKAIK